MITALFVEDGGVYCDRAGIDPWTIERDARTYRGPYRVIAHPPCKRWGRYWSGGPSAKVRRKLGDDDGCFAAALWAVRTFGGVIEHPEASKAWDWFGIARPNRRGGWTHADAYDGRSCCVEQGHYGHRARNATWLYAVGCAPLEMEWGPSRGVRLDCGFHSAEERAAAPVSERARERESAKQRLATPGPFADLLIRLVGGAE